MITYRLIPDIVAGYELENYRLAILRARAGENLIANPSVETNTTGHLGITGGETLTRVTTQQRRGVYSLQISGGTAGGSSYGNVTLAANTLYFGALDILGVAGVRYRIGFRSNAGVAIAGHADKFFQGTGHWQRVWVAYQEKTGATRRFIVRQASGATQTFYIDGLQVEQDRLTTYIDGDQRGLVRNQQAYYWTGLAHASTSIRIAATRAGGEEVDLRNLGFRIMALVGLGFSGISNFTLPNASLGGAFYQRSVREESTFDLVGTIMAESDDPTAITRNRKELTALLRPRAAIIDQPLIIRAYQTDGCGNDIAEPVDIPCLYAGGMQGNRDNHYQERAQLTFTTYFPYFSRLAGNVGSALAKSTTVTGNYALRRSNGIWAPLGINGGGGFNNVVHAIAVDPLSKRVYFGGQFTTGDGVTLNRIGYWDAASGSTGTFTAMGTGANGIVFAIAIAANGDVWIGGSFSTVNGVAASGLARWNYSTSTWTQFNDSAGAIVYAIDIAPNGDVWIGGTFSNWEGDAGSDNIAYSTDNGVNWNTAGTTGANGDVRAIHASIDGRVYVGGAFSAINGVTVEGAGYWDGTTFVDMGLGLSGIELVYVIAESPAGELYVGGAFADGGGDTTADNIAIWNGSQWRGLGNGTDQEVFSLHFADDGLLYVGGAFTIAGDLTDVNRFAAWNGFTWVYVDLELPTTNLYAIGSALGKTFIGYDTNGAATSAGLTTVNNPGSAEAYAIMRFTGPGRIFRIESITVGSVLYFNLELESGEQAVLNLTPGSISFRSNMRPNLIGTILPGSTTATFRLAPGDNVIGVLIPDATIDTIALIEFAPLYESLDDAAYP